VQYLADGDVSTVSWFQEMMALKPKNHQYLTVTKNMYAITIHIH